MNSNDSFLEQIGVTKKDLYSEFSRDTIFFPGIISYGSKI